MKGAVMPRIESIDPLDMQQNATRPFSLGVKVNAASLIFVSGQTAKDADGNTVGDGDIKAQTRQIMRNIGTILRDGGATYENIVKLTMYVSDLGLVPEAVEARAEFLGDHRPASSSVQTILRPGALIEVEAIAAVDE